jgi:hypothetical protein
MDTRGALLPPWDPRSAPSRLPMRLREQPGGRHACHCRHACCHFGEASYSTSLLPMRVPLVPEPIKGAAQRPHSIEPVDGALIGRFFLRC